MGSALLELVGGEPCVEKLSAGRSVASNARLLGLSTVGGNMRRSAGSKKCFKVARYSFSGLIPPKFEHKLRRHKQSFGKIATTVVLDKDEKLL